MASPAAERGHEVRQRLLAAAAELIPERGWAAVSTRVLAERAGVTPSVVHYHFPSLPALLNEASVGLLRQVLTEVETRLDTASTPAEAVDAMLASADAYTGADSMSRLAVEAYLAAGRDESLREQLVGVVEGFRQRLGRRLGEQGVSAPDETAAVLLAAVDGLLLHRGSGAGPDAGPVAPVLRRLVS
ncbi:TetR/AcrR family transcriptional regulator [Prauserella halophila]|uniref:TetR/AcrR family transcriptional regulator n=1 Tax=Prauserella halophila TaxID=185641 RepID=A0ABN1VZE8_9PSEU|nr:TetR/AcrR family transcriptional regulator [Prauserella halophila]MCP2237263.1 transcriptional regulator, TetR family [Prauserella halophila]